MFRVVPKLGVPCVYDACFAFRIIVVPAHNLGINSIDTRKLQSNNSNNNDNRQSMTVAQAQDGVLDDVELGDNTEEGKSCTTYIVVHGCFSRFLTQSCFDHS